jgi:hypothetical protein
MAQAKVKLGLLYWRGVDFDQALAAIGARRDDESLVLMAIALALRAEDDGRMRRLLESDAAPTLVSLRALEWLSRSDGPLFAIVAYDLAVIADAADADVGADKWRIARYQMGLGRLGATPFASLAKPGRPLLGGGPVMSGIEAVEPDED